MNQNLLLEGFTKILLTRSDIMKC